MRTAKVKDVWRNIYEKPFKIKITRIDYQDLKGIGSGNINFTGGITAICGSNGVGKSTLLNAISMVLTSTPQPNKVVNLKLEGSELTAEFVDSGNTHIRRVSCPDGSSNPVIEESSIEVESILLDGSINAPALINRFSEMDNISDFFTSEEARLLSEEERLNLSYIIGKTYEKCEIYELELADVGIIPYFRVQSGGIEYGSESMGLGEVAVHFILWSLHRINNNSIVLMEEPETYLAPRSQEALLDVIAKIATSKKLWIIFTTHSPNIIKNIPMEHVRLLNRVNNYVEISTPENDTQYLYSLGLMPEKKGVIIVEDRCARELTKCWLGRFEPSIIQEYEVKEIGSKEKITTQIKEFPYLGRWFKLIGLFDGNERGQITIDNNRWEYSFLPGEIAPEQLLRDIALIMREELSYISGRNLQQINIAINSLEGRNHHDWIEEFPRILGLGYEQVIGLLFEVGMRNDDFNVIFTNSFSEFLLSFNNETS